MISVTSLLSLAVTLVIVGLIVWLLLWAIGQLGLPEPFNKVARAIVILAVVIYLVNLLLSLSGHPLLVR